MHIIEYSWTVPKLCSLSKVCEIFQPTFEIFLLVTFITSRDQYWFRWIIENKHAKRHTILILLSALFSDICSALFAASCGQLYAHWKISTTWPRGPLFNRGRWAQSLQNKLAFLHIFICSRTWIVISTPIVDRQQWSSSVVSKQLLRSVAQQLADSRPMESRFPLFQSRHFCFPSLCVPFQRIVRIPWAQKRNRAEAVWNFSCVCFAHICRHWSHLCTTGGFLSWKKRLPVDVK